MLSRAGRAGRVGRSSLRGATVQIAPISQVEAGGWSVVYDGTPPSDLVLTDFTYTEPGFDSTGAAVTKTITNTITKRVWGTYPNHATVVSSGTPNLYDGNRVALARKVRAASVIPGVTNNSTQISPKPIARWLTSDGVIIGNSLTVDLLAYHMDWEGIAPVACVVLTATDGTNSIVATKTATQVIGSGILAVPVVGYSHTFDITSLASGQIKVRAQIYPHLGVPNGTYSLSSVRDSDLETQLDLEAFHSLYFEKNVTRFTTPLIAYVNPTSPSGSPVTSTTDATAKAAPYASMRAAVDAIVAAQGNTAGAIVRVAAGELTTCLLYTSPSPRDH
jgi:hypothetical protein